MTDIHPFLATHPDCILVDITGTQGSTPREADTFMLVSQTAL
jgi:xanthine dehydrogenase accessory factor